MKSRSTQQSGRRVWTVSTVSTVWVVWIIAAIAMGFGVSARAHDTGRLPGWGIDACLSSHIDWEELPGYLELLKSSRIVWLRERGYGRPFAAGDRPDWAVDPWDTTRRRVWRESVAAGFRVVAFAGHPEPVPVEFPGNQLPEDLQQVYRQSFLLGHLTQGEVDAYEMVGEPDAHYCRDLPDRVAAYQKAVYLGIKDGSRAALLGHPPMPGENSGVIPLERLAHHRNQKISASNLTIVLSGGLAFPPGNWLDLAAENGIYEYTDAVNFHHYGYASDLAPAIRAHRAFGAQWSGRGELPVWITEAGLNNITPDDWHAPAARRAQAKYLIACAEAALAEQVVVFMPFILAHKGDPFAMTERADRTFPAWDQFRDFTHAHTIDPELPLIHPPDAISRIVMQWMPEPGTSNPFKVGGTYWFREGTAMRGQIRIYNFGSQESQVTIVRDFAPGVVVNGDVLQNEWSVRVPAGGRQELSIEIPHPAPEYHRETQRFSARCASDHPSVAPSKLVFRTGLRPADALPHQRLDVPWIESTSPGAAPPFSYISANVEPPEITSVTTHWTGINGMHIINENAGSSDAGHLRCLGREDRPGPLHPPMLVARVDGLPGRLDRGAIRLTVQDASSRSIGVRVDLIDDAGQRFTIIENLGRLRDELPSPTVWLAYADFHPWVFGQTVPGARFDPARVREVQLRFYGLSDRLQTWSVAFDCMEFSELPKGSGG